MTNSGRGRSLRIRRAVMVLMALVLGVGFVGLTATAAQAEDVTMAISFSPGSVQLATAGDPVRVTATIKNTSRQHTSEIAAGSVALAGVEEHVDMQIEGGECSPSGGNSFNCGPIERAAQKTLNIILTPKATSPLQEGQSANGNLTIEIGTPNRGSGTAAISIQGSKQKATGVDGTVTSIEGDPIEGVAVAIQDSKGQTFKATTDAAGNYRLDVEFAAGQTTITFTKEGFTESTSDFTAVIGARLRADIRMEIATEDEPSEAPSTSEAPVEKPKEDEGFGATMWILIILGALLVVGGIVAIVMLFRRGKDDDDDDDEGALANLQPSHRPSATQTGQLGVYDAARHRPGMDAPTMIHNGPLISDGDLAQYGATPPSPQGPPNQGFGPSYDPPTSGGGFGPSYDNPTSGGGFGPSYDNPTSGGGFGPSYGDRGSTQRFDAPRDDTRRYPSQDSGYGQRPDDRGGWGGDHGSHPDQHDPYGSPRDAHDQQRPPQPRDPYDQPPARDPYGQQPPRRRYRDEDDDQPDQRHRW